MKDIREKTSNKSFWNTTRIFIAVLSIVLFLSLIIVFLLTPPSEKNKFWIEILIALAGAALIVILVHIADRLILLGEVSKNVDAVLEKSLDQRIIRSQWATGVVGISSSLHATGFSEIINNADDIEIGILDTYIPDPITVTSHMDHAISEDCNFKFLVLDPESDQAKARADLLAKQGLDYEQFKHGTLTYMCTIASVAYKFNAYDKIKLRLYREPPVIPIYIFRSINQARKHFRDKLFFGFYTDIASYGNLHLEVGRIGQPLFEVLEEYFDRMWLRNEGNEMNLEEFVKTSCPAGYYQKT